MKKFLVIACVAILSLNVSAEERLRHLVSVGTDGIGWSGLGTKIDRDEKKSGIKDQESSESNLKLNYAYIFESKVMLGTEFIVTGEKTEKKETNGDKTTTELGTTSLALVVGYNFSDDLLNSWWIKAALGAGKVKSETKEPSGNTDADADVSFFTIEAGKRFKLLSNVTYSPSIAITSASYGGDAEDVGLDSSSSAQLNIIKFDVLF